MYKLIFKVHCVLLYNTTVSSRQNMTCRNINIKKTSELNACFKFKSRDNVNRSLHHILA